MTPIHTPADSSPLWDADRTQGRLKGKAIVSLNEHPDIRRIFADYHIETTDIRYTVGCGKGSEASEVLIFSWDVEAEPAGLFESSHRSQQG
ncbi:hypothetical protein [Halomonas sp. BN3-1]|uniref:hypothetical protein n=1 Tax=Halomonas sp. BN3-1 TaxID=2082393 RepID=UPI001963A56A|nr:hypothetical protein [Halomonas sp. BN3-1]